jgi:hypothetical protein
MNQINKLKQIHMNQFQEKDFKEMKQREQTEFFAMLAYAILRHPSCFQQAKEIVDFAEKRGVFIGVKHGIEEVLDEKC